MYLGAKLETCFGYTARIRDQGHKNLMKVCQEILDNVRGKG